MDALNPRKLTRDQLARFLPTHELVKAFEKLYSNAAATPDELLALQDSVQELLSSASSASAAAQSARAASLSAQESADLALLAQRGRPAQRSHAVDYIDFEASPAHAEKPRRLAWNSTDDTLNIHHEGGVTQQVGLEAYVRVQNDTGALIANGAVVGFSGASGGLVSGELFIADGSMPTWYLCGIATQDIADGEAGRVTAFGLVRELDTSAYSVGAELYASPSVAGGLTATKPTAPNFAVPVGVVAVSNASAGEIFVRPILELTKRYGRFLKTTDQTPAVINTAYAITFDAAGTANGVSIGAPASRIVCAHSGLYTFSASFQLGSGSASVKNVWLWFRKNGTDIANSALKVSLESSSAVNTQHRSIFESMAAGDYIELMWAADSTNVTLDNMAATAFAPAAPAVVLTVDQIQQ
jgi:hypothetical protein